VLGVKDGGEDRQQDNKRYRTHAAAIISKRMRAAAPLRDRRDG
jgi:hypothetical protein